MILYFSATGNCQYVAEKLGQNLGEQIISIAESFRQQHFCFYPSAGEKIILVVPIYFYGLPTIVNDFLDQLQLVSESLLPVYAVLTCGFSPGDAAKQLEQKLAKQSNCRLLRAFTVRMPDNYILLFKAPTKKQQEKVLLRAETSIEQIIVALRCGAATKALPKRGFLSRLFTALAYPKYLNGRKTGKFYSLDNCTGCGLCAEKCPVDAIRMENGRPYWQKPQCVQCLACLHHCPVEAVQYGKATKNKGRYLHPAVKN